jgi:hypothetical protein
MKTFFLTFGGGSPRYIDAANRLLKQAQSTGWFNSIIAVDPNAIFEIDPRWGRRNKKFVLSNPRGFGYWLWKPFLIRTSLDRIPEGSILVYADAGCEISRFGDQRFFELISLLAHNDILAYELGELTAKWTKGDALHYFGVRLDSKEVLSKQLCATVVMVKNTSTTRKLVSLWQSTCEFGNYFLVDDTKSIQVNHPMFIEHRHDQAIFSLLCSESNTVCRIPDETYHSNFWRKRQYPCKLPFHALRNADGASWLDRAQPV